jgi:hypothetical protein
MYFEWRDPLPALVSSLRWLRELFAFGRSSHRNPDFANDTSAQSVVNRPARSGATVAFSTSDTPLR